MTEFKVDISKILASGLGFEAYFILYCLYTKDKQLIYDYTKKCKIINTKVFKELEEKKLIKIKAMPENNVYFELLSLTDEGRCLLLDAGQSDTRCSALTSEHNFEEFLTYYPSMVKNGLTTRRLHGNRKKCRSFYDKLLLETTHDILCKCAKAYHNEKIRSNSVVFMQNLETWLNQRNYLQYIEDAKQIQLTKNNTIENTSETTNLDAI